MPSGSSSCFVAESHRLKCQYGFAHFVHRFDRFLESLGGEYRTKLTAGIDNHSHPAGHRGAEDASDKRTGLRPLLADADSVCIARNASVADVDVVSASGDILTGLKAHCDVAAARCEPIKRPLTLSGVVAAGCELIERPTPASRVAVASGVALECVKTVGGVVIADCITQECIETSRCVLDAARIAKKRISTIGRVAAGIVVLQRTKTGRRVGASGCEVEQRVRTVGRVSAAGCEARERPAPFCGVAVLQV